MKKRLLAICLVVVMVLTVFVGCSDSETPATETPVDSKTPVASEEPVAPDVTPSGEVKKIELYLQKTNAVDQFTEIIKLFEIAHPDIKVELTSVPDPETALIARFAADDYPDIITTWPADIFYRSLMRDGVLMDISDQKFLDAIAPDSREIAKYDGKDYALSMTMSGYGIIMNNKIFAENNLEAPRTWDELIAACEVLQAAGVQPFTFYGKSTEQVGQLGERMFGAVDNDIIDSIRKVASGELTGAEIPQFQQLADALVQLHSYGQKDILGSDYDTAFNELASEKAAMILYGSWGIKAINNINPDLDIQMIPLPNPTGGKTNVAVSIDTALSISESSKNKEAALTFLEFMASTEIAQLYADIEKNPPLIKGVTYNVDSLKLIQSEMMAGNVYFTPSVYWPAGFRTSWESPLQALIDPTGTHDTAAFIAATDEIIKEYFV